MVSFDMRFAKGALQDHEWQQFQSLVTTLHEHLHQGQVPGGDFLGWIHLASQTLEHGLNDIQEVADEIRNQSDALVVIGIVGSYLGARAAFEWCKPEYYNQLPREQRGGPELYFAGNHLSPSALHQLMTVLEGKKVYLNVISKSGTTTEPAVAFRILRSWLEQQVGRDEAKRRIVVTTDKQKGALKSLANTEGYRTFVIPDDVGGRFSVLTPVGLLPLAAVGVDVRALLEGAAHAESVFGAPQLTDNLAYQYAAVRNALYRKGKTTEVLASYEPSLRLFAEWWKQLFGESEGKDGKGIFPASVSFTTDLHSMGQYIQEGFRNLFETVVTVKNSAAELPLPSDPSVDDGLEYLATRPLSWVNDTARLATQIAHADGQVPNLLVSVEHQKERDLGELFYFFESACAMSGLLLGVNPFNQPGVEAYKVNMFALLGKSGFEDQKSTLENRLRS